MTVQRVGLYASVGPLLTHYEVDEASRSLLRRDSVQLPANLQYAWPHARLPLVYAASSSRISRDAVGTEHFLSVLAIDPATGRIAPRGEPVRLPHRPIHLTTDSACAHVLVAFNNPSDLQVYRLAGDGSLGERVAQRLGIDTGVFPHQIRITPDDRLAILVTRGNPFRGKDPHAVDQTEPGALKIFQYRAGVLGEEVSVAPQGGYRFGPRHIDFHPRLPLVYVSLETQNRLLVFRRRGDAIDPEPLFERELLATPHHVPSKQGAGTIHVHPDGRFLYCVNRGHVPVEHQGQKVLIGADNTFAVFTIDPSTGEPTLIQHIDSGGICARTFAIHPGGRLLAAANCESHLVREGDAVRRIPGRLALFDVHADGRLGLARTYDVELAPQEKLFWMGLIGY